jgi:hypothetical protein
VTRRIVVRAAWDEEREQFGKRNSRRQPFDSTRRVDRLAKLVKCDLVVFVLVNLVK